MGGARGLFGSRAVVAGVVLTALGLILGAVAHRNQGYYTATLIHAVPSVHWVQGWPNTLYDAATIIAWLLVLVGLVWVVAGLIRYRNALRQAGPALPPS
ncbi:MAG TPA: hypothetical protein VMH88_05680 [Gemmatimonadales bacterium]|nr:hypothetical protein [Gemmatimonadales bacterium]